MSDHMEEPVSGPTCPSGDRFSAFWYQMTYFSVCGPTEPSSQMVWYGGVWSS
ncbi:hypothetical protein NGB36_03970 [Streptomyces sp. RB6PN25]|uniref:Uncharacterized protein n=1 Tax=Streptomyces humicola TaxID=2953240 RepID=A0ABT1PQ12_9ACTN|nr:hypothetical protein [Streptomyces humicola]MCQ4079771.1 hypothetical protein [Streptomyces humicola]